MEETKEEESIVGVSKQMQIEEIERVAREEYDDDGNPKDGFEDLDDIETERNQRKGKK